MSSTGAEGKEPIPYQSLLDENHALQDENRALKDEMQSLKARLEEADELRRAISEGDLDALVIPRPEGELIFTLDSADQAYRILVETMNEGTATLAFDGTILYCNCRFAELLRMPLQAVIGTLIFRFIAPESMITFDALLEHKMNTGEVKLRTEDGKSLPVYLSVSSLQAEGSPNAWCLVVTDLTEQKKNEEIVAAERLARSIIEQAAETLVVCDMSGRIIRFSNAMSMLCRCDPTFQQFEDLIDLRFLEGAEAGERILPVSSALKGSTSIGVKAVFESEKRQKFHSILNSGPLKNDDGEIIGCVVTLTDITELKKAEEALRDSEERYHELFDSIVDGIIITDLAGNILKVNLAYEKMLGYSMEELRYLSYQQLTPARWHESEARIVREQIFEHGYSDEYEKEYIRKDGSIFPISLRVWLSRDKLGQPRGMWGLVRDITDRKRAEEALKKAHDILEEKVKERTSELEEAYNSLLENEIRLNEAQKIAHLGNWDWNPITDELYWSNEVYRIFELDPLEFDATYDAFLNFVHPDDLGYVENVIKEALLSGKPFEVDYRIILANERERIVHAQGEIFFDEKNTPVQVKGIVQDITERKKAEEMLKESESKLKALFNLLPVGVSIIDKNRNILDANLALERILGLSRSDLVKGMQETRKYIRSDGTEMLAEEFPSIRALKEKGSIQSSEIGIIKEDGSTIWTDVSTIALPFSDGQVVVITRDITKQKKAEEKIQTLANAVESSDDAIITESLEGIIKSWNRGAEQIYGYSAEEVMGKDVSILEPANLKGEVRQLIENIKQGKRIQHYETLRLKKEGTLINVSITISPIFNTSGELVAISAIVRDITEHIKAQKALEKIEKIRIKEIHHRIKNNLQVISSLLDLQAETFEDEKAREAFRQSQDRVISMALIHEELYKGEGTDKLDFSAYLQKLIENLFQTYSLSSKNIRLCMDLEENAFLDMDTAVPLGIIVNELISNSLKHAFPGRDEGEIQIKLLRKENGECINNREESNKESCCKSTNFILIVSDDGIGIPESLDLEDLDSLGFQLIVSLVDQLDGELELIRNNGTEFTMKFTVTEKNNKASTSTLHN